jgi:TonB family protein
VKVALLVMGLAGLAAIGQTVAPPPVAAGATDLALPKDLDGKLDRLVDLLGLAQMMSNAQIAVVMSQLGQNSSTAPEFRAEFLMRYRGNQAVRAAINNAAKQEYATRFTASEIDELIAFYESPVGKKERQLTASIATGAMARVTPVTYPLLLGVITSIAREHPEYLRNRPAVAGGLGGPNGGAPLAPGVLGAIIGAVPSTAPFPLGSPRDGAGMASPPPPPMAKPAGPALPSGPVMDAFLIEKVQPTYPPLAKTAGVQGQVEFIAIISKDGHLQNLELVRGPPLLVQAAMDAVKQWRYIPTLVNAEPVNVITRIVVNFSLSP